MMRQFKLYEAALQSLFYHTNSRTVTLLVQNMCSHSTVPQTVIRPMISNIIFSREVSRPWKEYKSLSYRFPVSYSTETSIVPEAAVWVKFTINSWLQWNESTLKKSPCRDILSRDSFLGATFSRFFGFFAAWRSSSTNRSIMSQTCLSGACHNEGKFVHWFQEVAWTILGYGQFQWWHIERGVVEEWMKFILFALEVFAVSSCFELRAIERRSSVGTRTTVRAANDLIFSLGRPTVDRFRIRWSNNFIRNLNKLLLFFRCKYFSH